VSFDPTGALIFGYDVLANWFTACNSESSAGTAADFRQFTGKERDAESGLDYFGARYYGSALGRFTSADIPFADQDEYDPQSWNLYSYVRNNPLRNIDPDGRTCTFAKTSSGADIITDADGKGCAELHDNTVHAYDEPGIAMLASVGAKLTDPHEWVDLTSRAARSAASVEWPLASNIAECTVPGGDCENDGTSLLAKAPIWSRTNRLSRVKNAYAHWLKHGKEFPNLQNAKQYAEAAENFVTNPPAGTLSKLRPNGETVLYEPSTNTFAVKGADGAPKTMFKPSSGANYFNAQ
jgi:RHS repeat-associated protein